MKCPTAELLRVHLRWMTEKDLDAVYALEQSASEKPWSAAELVRILSHPHCAGMVVEYDSQVIGFIIYELQEFAFRIWNMAVLPEFRRQGVGSQMIARLACRLASHSRKQIRIAVRESNLPAQLFFRALGFQAVSIQRAANEKGEDTYLMQYRHRTRAYTTQGV
ncbi:MAG: GNAT family N-acetyltransferase [Planctomycetia bacterium]|nr:GNAT family N-acetyltransferase [Planctomycetia bacterium]